MARRKRHCRFGVVKSGRRKGSCLKHKRAKGGLSGARRRKRR